MKAPSMSSAVIAVQPSISQNADIRGGRQKIVDNRETYVIKLDQQTDEQFESMVKMAPVYILYPKVVDGFTGTVFSKSPNMTGLDTDKYLDSIQNVDMLGNSINELSEKIVKNVIEDGFCATYNDYMLNGVLDKSFIRHIKPADFISIRTSSEKGYPEISQFIYKENIEVQSKDSEFDTETKLRYIVLDLDNSQYRIRTFQAEDSKYSEITQIGEDVYPKKDNKVFDYIPIQIHGTEPNNFTVGKSPLQDISDMNISVIQRVVDQVYMLHWTALPTPYVIGVDDDDAPSTIGPSKIWHISNVEASVGMLEFSGNSARAHQDFIDNLKDIMAATGAQILKKEGVSRETATSVLVRTAAQTSLISTLVKNVSKQIENTLKIYFDWQGIKLDEGFSYKLNNDFVKIDMEPNAQIALVKSWLDGAVSHETVFEKMKEGELINPNKTFEKELKLIKDNPPPFFSLEKEAELNTEASEKESTVGDGRGKDDGITNPIKGSNLDNGNIQNKQATKQV